MPKKTTIQAERRLDAPAGATGLLMIAGLAVGDIVFETLIAATRFLWISRCTDATRG